MSMAPVDDENKPGSPNTQQANSENTPVADEAEDPVSKLDSVRDMHWQLHKFWGAHGERFQRIWETMTPTARRELFQIVSPDAPENPSLPYITINGRRTMVDTSSIHLIPEFCIESLVNEKNLVQTFNLWTLPPLDVVAWEALKFTRFKVSQGHLKLEEAEDENEFVFILGERFGQHARMRQDADTTEVLNMNRTKRRGALSTVPEFSLVEDRLYRGMTILSTFAEEFANAYIEAGRGSSGDGLAVEVEEADASAGTVLPRRK